MASTGFTDEDFIRQQREILIVQRFPISEDHLRLLCTQNGERFEPAAGRIEIVREVRGGSPHIIVQFRVFKRALGKQQVGGMFYQGLPLAFLQRQKLLFEFCGALRIKLYPGRVQAGD